MSERQLLEQLFAKSGDLDSLREDLDRLRNQVSANNSERNVGNPLGGPIRTEIAPGLLPIGPYRQDVDATFSLEFTLWLSEELLRIRKMTIHLTPKASRLAAGVVASGGGSTSGSSSESTTETEGATPVNVSAANHTHIWLSWVSNTAMTGGTTVSGAVTSPTGTPSATQTAAISPHTHNETGGVTGAENQAAITPAHGLHTHTITLAANQSVAVIGNMSKWGSFDSAGSADATRAFDMIPVAGHANDYYTSAAQTGDVNVADASHTHGMEHDHTTPDHTHDVTLDISESGMADDLEIIIDGVNRTTLLGGPWTAASDIVLDPNMLQAVGFVDVRLNPVTGPHTIEVTSSAEGAVEVVGDYSVVIKAVQ